MVHFRCSVARLAQSLGSINLLSTAINHARSLTPTLRPPPQSSRPVVDRILVEVADDTLLDDYAGKLSCSDPFLDERVPEMVPSIQSGTAVLGLEQMMQEMASHQATERKVHDCDDLPDVD